MRATNAIRCDDAITIGMGPIKITPPNSTFFWDRDNKIIPRKIRIKPKKNFVGFIITASLSHRSDR